MQIAMRLFAAAFILGMGQQRLLAQATGQSFLPLNACRAVDTRVAYGGAGPILAGQTRDFPISGNCNLPSTATAFSLNITVVPSEGGILQYLTVYPKGTARPNVSTLNDYLGTVVANAAIVQAGLGQVTVYVTDTTDVIIDADGYFMDESLPNQNTSLESALTQTSSSYPNGNFGNGNTGVGFFALEPNSGASGSYNTATGQGALASNASSSENAAFGAGYAGHGGSNGVALGYYAGFGGSQTVAAGSSAGYSYRGNDSIAIGYQTSAISPLASPQSLTMTTAVGYMALIESNTNFSTPNLNTAIGYKALTSLSGGTSNIALGSNAGNLVTTGGSNIEIGNTGTSGDGGFIRIGTAGTQTSSYIAGISGMTVTGSAVLVNSSGQLGVQASSIRYKEAVQDMGDTSDGLMNLRPVEFRYKQPDANGTKSAQFGLVAEEVAQVYPELVIRGSNGLPETVEYHELPAMLLNEIQGQQRTIEGHEKAIAQQGKTMADQQSEIDKLRTEAESLRSIIVPKQTHELTGSAKETQ